MMTCRATTKKKTADEIRRYLLPQFGDRLLKEIGLFELQTHLNKLAQELLGFGRPSRLRQHPVDLQQRCRPGLHRQVTGSTPGDARDQAARQSVLPAATIMALLEGTEDPMDRCALGNRDLLRASHVGVVRAHLGLLPG